MPITADAFGGGMNTFWLIWIVIPAGSRDKDKCNNFKVLQIKMSILVKLRERLQLEFGKKVPIYY